MPRCPVPLARHSALQVGVIRGQSQAPPPGKSPLKGGLLEIGSIGPNN